eukprot:CAMPEP_0170647488 /NCGR_PEP_ID=MMETSP0224-20130122/44214_1 /TAXON_ID=285029 /ORGANISM="Togula jolla, Strain CCCM 725" /LENGTH=43 /DNA_ID= /DNA_START= /DNA_END= /DNA_ORIENTATION=
MIHSPIGLRMPSAPASLFASASVNNESPRCDSDHRVAAHMRAV